MPRILLVDDKVDQIAMSVEAVLDEYELDLAPDGVTALEKAGRADCVLLDIRMPAHFADVDEEEGLAVLGRLRSQYPNLPVIMLTSYADVDLVVRAMKLGAYHYVTKPPDVPRLRQLITSALADTALRRHTEVLEKTIAVRDDLSRPGVALERDRLGALVGASPAMQRIYEVIERAARVDVSVLILGASGTGKELVARELYRLSSRAKEPFVAVNCAAIPRELLESTLFGHRKGSFTGATEDRQGDFLLARGGILFLDEIGDMPFELQAKLLRVLQDKTVRAIGSDKYVPVDVRILSSTNQDLGARMKEGRFRQDLYYRLNVVRIELPLLSERGGDIDLLAGELLARTCAKFGVERKSFSPRAVDRLRRHTWPGNVRELEHTIEQAVALCAGNVLSAEDLAIDDSVAVPVAAGTVDEAWAVLTSGREDVDIVAARNRWGEGVLAEVIRRAIRQTSQARAAGELLGFVPQGADSAKAYDSFRQWLRRLGISSREIVGR